MEETKVESNIALMNDILDGLDNTSKPSFTEEDYNNLNQKYQDLENKYNSKVADYDSLYNKYVERFTDTVRNSTPTPISNKQIEEPKEVEYIDIHSLF